MFDNIYKFYKKDDTFDEAASLSFYTLFAVIPTLLISFSVIAEIKGIEPFLDRINSFLVANLLPVNQEAVRDYIEEFIHNSAEIGMVGVGFVIVTSMLFFMDYEYIINKIYGTKIKSYIVSIATYFLLTAIFPITLFMTFYVSDEVQIFLHNYAITQDVETSWLMPYFFLWLMFFLSYKISPNKSIQTKAAFWSSLFAACLWIFAKDLFVFYAFYNKNYVTLYGQVSILMLFMLWIYLSWVIFIYGLKFCKYLEDKGYFIKETT